MLLFCVLCLVNIFLTGGLLNSTVSPLESSVVAIGIRVELNCSISENDSVTWKYTPWNSSTETNIYLGRDIVASTRSRYKIDKNISGQHNLIIDSVDFDHAGRYECIAIMQQSTMSHIQLTVLGSNPDCVANISAAQNDRKDQMRLSIWCSITYTGHAAPVFSWTKHNVGLPNNVDVNATDSQTSHRQGPVTRMFSIIPYDLQTNDSGITFQCRITFQNLTSNFQGYLFTVYEYTWKYTLYGTKNLSIVRHEDSLYCSADGNPVPTYRWINVETNTSTDGSVLALNGTFISNKDHTFQCTAANIFGTENMNITIQGVDAGVTEGVPVTAVAIVVSLILLLIIAVIVSCVVCRKRLKDNASDRPDVALNTDISPYDEVALSSDRTSDYILEQNRLLKRSDGGMIADNAVYSEVSKPKGRSNGKSRGNPGENSRPIQSQTQGRKNFIGADGTEYAELSGVKPPDRKGEVSRPTGFSRVDVYASIDHNGRAPPPPPRF